MRRRPLVRPLTLEDLPGCKGLCAAIRWPWEMPKWKLLLSHGEGFGVEAPDGSLVGSVVLNRFGDAAASIGLLGVAPAWSRQGLGRALMERALERAGSVPVFLYASEQGRGLYAQLGFGMAGAVCRLAGELSARPVCPPLGGRRLRPMEAADLAEVARLDALAFGGPRPAHLQALLALAEEARVAEDGEQLVGYGLGWSVGTRRTLGPIVAADTQLAIALAGELANGHRGPLRIDVPEEFPSLLAWGTALGLRPDGPAPLMVLHASRPPGRREALCALAMRALG